MTDSGWSLFCLYVHIVGVLGFMTSHGTATLMTFKLRAERDPARIRAWLDLSASSRRLMEISTLLILAGGIANGFLGHYWAEGWIWAGLGLFILLMAVPIPLAVPYYRKVRRAVGAGAGDDPSTRTATPDELDALLMSGRPVFVAWFETIGIAVIVFLMVFKPF